MQNVIENICNIPFKNKCIISDISSFICHMCNDILDSDYVQCSNKDCNIKICSSCNKKLLIDASNLKECPACKITQKMLNAEENFKVKLNEILFYCSGSLTCCGKYNLKEFKKNHNNHCNYSKVNNLCEYKKEHENNQINIKITKKKEPIMKKSNSAMNTEQKPKRKVSIINQNFSDRVSMADTQNNINFSSISICTNSSCVKCSICGNNLTNNPNCEKCKNCSKPVCFKKLNYVPYHYDSSILNNNNLKCGKNCSICLGLYCTYCNDYRNLNNFICKNCREEKENICEFCGTKQAISYCEICIKKICEKCMKINVLNGKVYCTKDQKKHNFEAEDDDDSNNINYDNNSNNGNNINNINNINIINNNININNINNINDINNIINNTNNINNDYNNKNSNIYTQNSKVFINYTTHKLTKNEKKSKNAKNTIKDKILSKNQKKNDIFLPLLNYNSNAVVSSLSNQVSFSSKVLSNDCIEPEKKGKNISLFSYSQKKPMNNDYINYQTLTKLCKICRKNISLSTCSFCFQYACRTTCTIKCNNQNCMKLICLNCSRFCNICKKTFCVRCAMFCTSCKQSNSLVSCVNCKANVIIKCSIWSCKKTTCLKCYNKCNHCGEISCQEHSLRCCSCGESICQFHWHLCRKCGDNKSLAKNIRVSENHKISLRKFRNKNSANFPIIGECSARDPVKVTELKKVCLKNCTLKCSFCDNEINSLCLPENHMDDYVTKYNCKHLICNACLKHCDKCKKLVRTCPECRLLDEVFEHCFYCNIFICIDCAKQCMKCGEYYCYNKHECFVCKNEFENICLKCIYNERTKCQVCEISLDKECEVCQSKFICSKECYLKAIKNKTKHIKSNSYLNSNEKNITKHFKSSRLSINKISCGNLVLSNEVNHDDNLCQMFLCSEHLNSNELNKGISTNRDNESNIENRHQKNDMINSNNIISYSRVKEIRKTPSFNTTGFHRKRTTTGIVGIECGCTVY